MKKLLGIMIITLLIAMVNNVFAFDKDDEFYDENIINILLRTNQSQKYEHLTYRINDNKVSIVACDINAVGEIVIPSEIEGYPVTIIANWVFNNCPNITSLKIPESIAEINNIEGIANFVDCPSLAEIIVDINNSSYSSDNGVLYNKTKTELIKCPEGHSGDSYTIPDNVVKVCSNAFKNNIDLKSVSIGENTEVIENSAFENSGIVNISIPDSVKVIEGQTFANCESLTNVTIGSGLTKLMGGGMETTAFLRCGKLRNIEVTDANENFSSENGVLFNKEKTELIQYPIGKTDTEYIIPDRVTNIGYYAFLGSNELNKVKMPVSLKTINEGAFKECKVLNNVSIPKEVTYIGIDAFHSCESLEEVTIPETVTKIDVDAFYGCYKLNYVIIEDGVLEIGDKTFGECYNLNKIIIPETVSKISADTFIGCDNLSIYGISESYAEQYANKYNIKFYVITNGWNWETLIEKSNDETNTYICTAKNVSAGTKAAEFIAAYYDEFGNMLGIEKKNINRNSGEKDKIEIKIPENIKTELKTIKAFVWDSFESMNAESQCFEYIVEQ